MNIDDDENVPKVKTVCDINSIPRLGFTVNWIIDSYSFNVIAVLI